MSTSGTCSPRCNKPLTTWASSVQLGEQVAAARFYTFHGQQLALVFESAGKAPQSAARGHHAVAGNDDRYRVPPERVAYGTYGAGSPNAVGDFLIRTQVAVLDAGGLLQNASGEVTGKPQVDRQVEALTFAGEVLA